MHNNIEALSVLGIISHRKCPIIPRVMAILIDVYLIVD